MDRKINRIKVVLVEKGTSVRRKILRQGFNY